MSLTRWVKQILRDMQAWGRNAKVTAATEVFWSMPISWVSFYQTIFMRELGMDEALIGFSITLTLILQVSLPVLGGYLADRFGRKRTIMFFDAVGWLGTTGMLFIAREFWHIIVAMAFLGLPYTIEGVWNAYLGEDTLPQYRGSVFSFIRLAWIVAGLLTPIAGALISLCGVEQGFRYISLTAIIATATMLVIRQVMLRESGIGKMLLSSENRGSSRPKSYVETLRMIARQRKILTLFVLSAVGSLSGRLITTFGPLFLTDLRALALDESVVSVMPMASSISSIVVLSLVVPRLKPEHIGKALLVSYVSGLLGLVTLVMAPRHSMFLAILSTVFDSTRFVATFAILPVLIFNTVDEVSPLAQAKIMSLTMTFSALASWPMPALGGLLYTMNPTFPFLLAAISLLAGTSLLLSKTWLRR